MVLMLCFALNKSSSAHPTATLRSKINLSYTVKLIEVAVEKIIGIPLKSFVDPRSLHSY
jgi:hypothetical protein